MTTAGDTAVFIRPSLLSSLQDEPEKRQPMSKQRPRLNILNIRAHQGA